MPLVLRPAVNQDFDFCSRLYFEEMQWIIDELHLDQTAQEVDFTVNWDPTHVRILMLDDAEVGWMQTVTHDKEVFVAQIVVARGFQKKGIGTEVMNRVIRDAAPMNKQCA